jgi:hypothetical protein
MSESIHFINNRAVIVKDEQRVERVDNPGRDGSRSDYYEAAIVLHSLLQQRANELSVEILDKATAKDVVSFLSRYTKRVR